MRLTSSQPTIWNTLLLNSTGKTAYTLSNSESATTPASIISISKPGPTHTDALIGVAELLWAGGAATVKWATGRLQSADSLFLFSDPG